MLLVLVTLTLSMNSVGVAEVPVYAYTLKAVRLFVVISPARDSSVLAVKRIALSLADACGLGSSLSEHDVNSMAPMPRLIDRIWLNLFIFL